MAKYIHIKNELKPHLRDIGDCSGKLVDFLKTIDLVNPKIELNGKDLYDNKKFIVNDDYELKEDDSIVILNRVKGGAITFIYQAIISIAVSYVISKVFGGDKPSVPQLSQRDGTQAQTEFTINTSQNQARNGEPIPECFGNYVRVPDIISAPYRRYDNNKQYLYMLLCIGKGQNTVNDVFIEDTISSSFQDGTIYKRVYKTESEHTGNDKIKNDWNNNIPLNSFTLTNVISGENIGVSILGSTPTPAIISLEPNSLETTYVNFKIKITASGSNEIGMSCKGKIKFKFEYKNNGITIKTSYSSSIEVTNETKYIYQDEEYNEGQYDEVYITSELESFTYCTPSLSCEVESYKLNENIFTPDPYFRDIVITSKEIQDFQLTNSTDFNPIQLNPSGTYTDLIEFDITLPNGLYNQNDDSSLSSHSVSFRFTYINKDGVVTNINETITDTTRDPIRKTYSYSVSPSWYKTKVQKTSIDSTSTRVQESLYLESMKAYLINNDVTGDGHIKYGDMTLMAVKIKATEGVSSKGQFKVKVNATRDNLTQIKDIMEYIWTSENGGRQNISGISLPSMEDEYNEVVTQRTTVFNALQSVGTSRRYNVFPSFNVITARKDIYQPIRTMVFSEANIVQGSLKITMSGKDDSDFNGIRCVYKDPISFDKLFATYPLDASFPEQVELEGVTDSVFAQEQAEFLYNQGIKRSIRYEFDTELDGFVPSLFDRCGLSHPTISKTQSGTIIGFDAISGTVQLNETLKEDYTNPKILFRSRTGQPSVLYNVTNISIRTLTLDISTNPLPTDLYTGDDEQKTIYQLGETVEFLDDIFIDEIRPKKNNIVSIKAWNYNDTIYP